MLSSELRHLPETRVSIQSTKPEGTFTIETNFQRYQFGKNPTGMVGKDLLPNCRNMLSQALCITISVDQGDESFADDLNMGRDILEVVDQNGIKT